MCSIVYEGICFLYRCSNNYLQKKFSYPLFVFALPCCLELKDLGVGFFFVFFFEKHLQVLPFWYPLTFHLIPEVFVFLLTFLLTFFIFFSFFHSFLLDFLVRHSAMQLSPNSVSTQCCQFPSVLAKSLMDDVLEHSLSSWVAVSNLAGTIPVALLMFKQKNHVLCLGAIIT